MNRKKLISMIGAIALLLGIGMNFRNALNDYGMAKSSLNGFMLVQASGTDSDSVWTKHSFEVTCPSTTTTGTATSSTTTTITLVKKEKIACLNGGKETCVPFDPCATSE